MLDIRNCSGDNKERSGSEAIPVPDSHNPCLSDGSRVHSILVKAGVEEVVVSSEGETADERYPRGNVAPTDQPTPILFQLEPLVNVLAHYTPHKDTYGINGIIDPRRKNKA